MRFEGKISQWNDDRGFGFITPAQGDQQIFFHISVFPKDGIRPRLGEKLTFEIETDSTGRKRAKNLVCLERLAVKRPFPALSRGPAPDRRKERHNFFARAIPWLLAMGLAAYGYGEYARRVTQVTAAEQAIPTPSPAYICDGRIHCAQMTSCDEAMFFLHNCPNTQMDGDGDGMPCERQWCTGR